MADWLQGPYTDINDGLVDSLLPQQRDLLLNALITAPGKDSVRVGEIIQAMNRPELFPSEQEHFLVMLTVTRILFDVDNLSESVGSVIKDALDRSVESFNTLLELCKAIGGNVFSNMYIVTHGGEATRMLGPDLSQEPRSILLEYNPQEAFLAQHGPKFGARVLYAMVNGLVTPDGHVRHEETMSMTAIWRDLLLSRATQENAMEWLVCGVIAEKAIKRVNQGLIKRKRPGLPVPEGLSTRISLN